MNTKTPAEQVIESTRTAAKPKLRLERERVARLQTGLRAGQCPMTHGEIRGEGWEP
jgi:hypothetical protein